MINCDDSSKLWSLLAALCLSDVPDRVRDCVLDIMIYLEGNSEEL